MGIKKVNVQLSETNLERFQTYHPGKNLSWALDMLLEKFLAQFDKTPEEYAELAAKELKEEQEL